VAVQFVVFVNCCDTRINACQLRLQRRPATLGFDRILVAVWLVSISFSATCRSISVSSARYTSAMPPRPSFLTISYLPKRV
jgi:hypothetical protein